ncbi:MAG: hypothetical protein QMC38_11900 [Sinobacterium sp.]
MDLRLVFLRLHQGEYGKANWAVLLVVALSFIITTVAGLVSYLMRKPQGNWGVPTLPSGFNVDKLLLVLIIFLGGLFPMFGISLIIIFTWGKLKKLKFSNQPNTSNG